MLWKNITEVWFIRNRSYYSMDLIELYKLKKKTFFKMRLPAKIHITSTLNSQDREITVTKHRSIRPEVFGKKGVLRISQNSQENICARVSFLIKLQVQACNFIKKETLAQVFSCEFCEISKNTFSYRTTPVAVSKSSQNHLKVEMKQ